VQPVHIHNVHGEQDVTFIAHLSELIKYDYSAIYNYMYMYI